MMSMATTRPQTEHKLQADAGLPEVIEAVNELSATFAQRASLSASRPLDAAHPSASIVYTDEAYDALAARLDEPPAPNEQLRRTMSGQATIEP